MTHCVRINAQRGAETGLRRDALSKDGHAEMHVHLRMFYAQRNMYLTGFTLFLAL